MIKVFEEMLASNLKGFLNWLGIDIICWGGYFGVTMLQEIKQTKLVALINNQVRRDFLYSLFSKNPVAFHEKDTGEYIARFTNDINQMETLAWRPFFSLIGRVAQVISCMVALLVLHWSLVLAALLVSFIMWLLPRLSQKHLEKLGKECSKSQEIGIGILKNLLRGYDVIHSFGRVPSFMHKGDEAGVFIEKPSCRLSNTRTIIHISMGYINVIMQMLTDALVVVLAFNKVIALSVYGGAANLTGGVATGLDNIVKCILALEASKPYFDKIESHCDNFAFDEQNQSGVIDFEKISFEHVSFAYNETPVLSDVNMEFKRNRKYAIVGRSGAGKTTLLKLLLGWLEPTSGEILFDGQNSNEFSRKRLADTFGYIEQDVFLFNDTIKENLSLGKKFTEEEYHKALQLSSLDDVIAEMPDGIDTIVGEEGGKLSGGQRQRVAIARALINGYSILIVDEGTSALDKKTADEVEKRLLKNAGLTLILVSHHLSEERKTEFDAVYEL